MFWKYWKTIMSFIDVENARKQLRHLVKNNVVDDQYTMKVIEEYYEILRVNCPRHKGWGF